MAKVRIFSAGKPMGIYDDSLVRALCWYLLFPSCTDFRLTTSVFAEKRTKAELSTEPGSAGALGIDSMIQPTWSTFHVRLQGEKEL